MAVDFSRLKTNAVITTTHPIQQPDEGWRYPIYVVHKVLKDTNEIAVIREDGSFTMLTEQELQRMNFVGAMLAHKDRLIREKIRENREKGSSANFNSSDKLALALCKEAERYYPDLDLFLGEISPETLHKAKAFLQETIEKEENIDQRAGQYKRKLRR